VASNHKAYDSAGGFLFRAEDAAEELSNTGEEPRLLLGSGRV
jgi:hypothetical protein